LGGLGVVRQVRRVGVRAALAEMWGRERILNFELGERGRNFFLIAIGKCNTS